MNKRLIISICLILLCICHSGCRNKNGFQERKKISPSTETISTAKAKTEKGHGGQETVTENPLIHIHNPEEFSKYILDSKIPCLIDFYSDHCPPCRMLAPIIEKLAKDYKGKAVVCKVCLDNTANREIAAQYSFRFIPTVIFLQDGKEVTRITGLRAEKEYREILDGMVIDKSSAGK